MAGTVSRIARVLLLGVLVLFAIVLAGGCAASRDYYYDEYNDEYEYEVDHPPADWGPEHR